MTKPEKRFWGAIHRTTGPTITAGELIEYLSTLDPDSVLLSERVFGDRLALVQCDAGNGWVAFENDKPTEGSVLKDKPKKHKGCTVKRVPVVTLSFSRIW